MSYWHLKQAARVIFSGGVVAYPTEAVYGLGCDPEDFAAVKSILLMKRRSMQKGLILVAADITQLDTYVDYPSTMIRNRVQQSWPGPTTWVLPATKAVPPWIKGSHTTVAVRVSAHPLVKSLCKMVGVLVSTSANPSHFSPAKTAFRVMNYFGGSLDYILYGKVSTQARPTVIKDALTDIELRS